MGVQLICPRCKHEFQYDNGYYDTNIARLGIEIRDIMKQLADHNLKPKTIQYANTDWWLRTKRALTIKQKELAELKAFRKIADQQRSRIEHEAFKKAVKEICGETAYMKCFETMKKDVESYSVSSTYKAAYSRADGKNLIGINNL